MQYFRRKYKVYNYQTLLQITCAEPLLYNYNNNIFFACIIYHVPYICPSITLRTPGVILTKLNAYVIIAIGGNKNFDDKIILCSALVRGVKRCVVYKTYTKNVTAYTNETIHR